MTYNTLNPLTFTPPCGCHETRMKFEAEMNVLGWPAIICPLNLNANFEEKIGYLCSNFATRAPPYFESVKSN